MAHGIIKSGRLLVGISYTNSHYSKQYVLRRHIMIVLLRMCAHTHICTVILYDIITIISYTNVHYVVLILIMFVT